MEAMVIYARKYQGNGYFPVDRFERTADGRWFSGMEKESGFKRNESFPDMDSGFRDLYFLSTLRNNYGIFSTTPIYGGYVWDEREGNITYEEIERVVLNS